MTTPMNILRYEHTYVLVYIALSFATVEKYWRNFDPCQHACFNLASVQKIQ